MTSPDPRAMMKTEPRKKAKLAPEHGVWNSMRNRCNNPKYHKYADYGGRGISVCPQWARFSVFIADMGPRPQGLTLERINNDGNYEPGNCKWASRRDQNNNRRFNRMVEFRGETMALGAAIHLAQPDASYGSIHVRIQRGWDVTLALTLPLSRKLSPRRGYIGT